MADLWRVTYMGEGVKPTEVGAFARNVTAYTSEEFARSVAGQHDWVVADPTGHEVGGGKPAAPKTQKHEKPDEKHDEKKAPEKAAEKHDDKKPADKKAEKHDDKKPAEKAEK